MQFNFLAKSSIVLGCAAILMVAYGAGAGTKKQTELERRTSDPRSSKFNVGDKKSGYNYMTAMTRDMQDDDFANPIEPSVIGGKKIDSN